jgi:hypothetical protein
MGTDWTKEWQEGEWEMDEEAIEWLRNLPTSVHPLLLKFPPSCLVKANTELLCPAPGEIGIVTSYTEPDEKCPEGQISVRQSPEAGIRMQCRPEWLEVVGYYKGITPDVIKLLLAKEDVKQ